MPAPPVTEHIAAWSARHRRTVVPGWLVMVALVSAAGQMLGHRNLPQYDAGQSAEAERTLNRLALTNPC